MLKKEKQKMKINKRMRTRERNLTNLKEAH